MHRNTVSIVFTIEQQSYLISLLSSVYIVVIMLFPFHSSPQNHHSPHLHQIASSSTFALREKREEMVAVTEVSLTPTLLLVKGSIMHFYHKYHQSLSTLSSLAKLFQAGEGGGPL